MAKVRGDGSDVEGKAEGAAPPEPVGRARSVTAGLTHGRPGEPRLIVREGVFAQSFTAQVAAKSFTAQVAAKSFTAQVAAKSFTAQGLTAPRGLSGRGFTVAESIAAQQAKAIRAMGGPLAVRAEARFAQMNRVPLAIMRADAEAEQLWASGIAQRVMALQAHGDLPPPPKWDDGTIGRALFPQGTSDSPPAVHPDVLALAVQLAPPDWKPSARPGLDEAKAKTAARVGEWKRGRAAGWRELASKEPKTFLSEVENARDSKGKGRELSKVAGDFGLGVKELEALIAAAEAATRPKRRGSKGR